MNAKVAHLQDRAVLTVSGPDACDFLHNVVTADVAVLQDGQAAYSALLTPQGKVLFDFFIYRAGGSYLIDCASEQLAGLTQRLTMYKLRADVTITPEAAIHVYALWDGKLDDKVRGFADPRSPEMGWRVFDELQSNCDAGDYTAHRVSLGIAQTMPDIGSGEVFPHEANLDQLGAISFSKGCYIGQEVVSRMQHRGTARTRFVIVDGVGALEPGAEVSAGGRRIGVIKSVAGQQALALLRIDRVASALAAGDAIVCADAEVTVRVPPWASFSLEPQKDDAS